MPLLWVSTALVAWLLATRPQELRVPGLDAPADEAGGRPAVESDSTTFRSPSWPARRASRLDGVDELGVAFRPAPSAAVGPQWLCMEANARRQQLIDLIASFPETLAEVGGEAEATGNSSPTWRAPSTP